MIPHSSVLEAALFSFFDASLPFASSTVLLSSSNNFFPRLSVNLKTKICLNWLQRAQRGFVSMVMRLLIGPEAQAANRPLLACRGLCLLVSLMNSFADGGWQGLIYQAGPEGWWGRRWLEQVKKNIKGEQISKSCCCFGFLMSSGSKVVLPPGVEFGPMVCDQSTTLYFWDSMRQIGAPHPTVCWSSYRSVPSVR